MHTHHTTASPFNHKPFPIRPHTDNLAQPDQTLAAAAEEGSVAQRQIR
jgi:hypothetical protein